MLVEEARRRAPSLPSPRDARGQVTALLPCRDEEANVVACADSLLAQTAAPAVWVIDDGSTDATAVLAAARAAGEPRLHLLAAGPLPDGWRGKVHALAVGDREVTTPWLLTTDADARLAPELVARALAAAEEGGLAGISLAGFQETRGLGENLLVPPVFALLDALLGDWQAAADGTGPPVFNGQFVLLRKDAWDASGGFEPIRAETLDDVAAAVRLRQAGHRTGFFREPGLRVRMYRGWAEAAQGWRRNLGGLFGLRPGLTAAVLGITLVPAAALLAALATSRWVEAVLLWSAGAAASTLLRSSSGHPPAYGLLYPLDGLALAWVLAIGVRDRRRGRLTTWKGREIKV